MKRNLLFLNLLFVVCIGNLSAQTSMGPWNPILYPGVVGSPGWEVQDNNATGSLSDPYASWSRVVDAIESGGANQTITILPDAFIESFDYDNSGGSETTLGHNLATELNITSAQNGLTINGSPQGCYTLFDNTSNGSGSLFGSIGNANNITIKGLYLLNGYAGVFDISNSTNITFEDCIFDNNDLNGVEVFNIASGNTGTSVTFTNCKFINHNNNGIVMNVNRDSGTMPIDLTYNNCVWSCNSSTSGGSAMKVTNGATGGITMDFTGCTFAGNTSTGAQGGAIWFDGSETTTTFTNTNFINNTVTGGTGGGALFIGTNDNVTMTGCNFYGNKTTNLSSDGGAIYAFSGSSGTATLSISNTTFDSNDAADDGGAVCMRYANVTMDNVHIVNNDAGDGILTLANGSVNLTISNYTCAGNTGPDGCIYNRGPGTLVDNGGAATGSFVDLSGSAADYTCGAYCATEVPATCNSVAQSAAICALPGSLSISGEVWEDVNGNGIQEAGDNGIANAYVLLYDSNSNLIGRTNTDGTGNYTFTGLPAGNYYVVFVNPDLTAHPNIAPANAGTETTDSDIINSLTNATANINTTSTDIDGAFTNIVLPVELLNFSGKKSKENVELNWTTATELNNEGFFIERKMSGLEWQELGFVKGNGNSSLEHTYLFMDDNPKSGDNIYRLKQSDFDGNFAYSSVVVVKFSERLQALNFHPNPVQDRLTFDLEILQAGDAQLQIFDYSGKEIYKFFPSLTSGFNQISFDVEQWQAGVYFARLSMSNGEQLTGRIVKK